MPTLVGNIRTDIDFDKILEKKGLGDHGDAQKALDSEVIRLMQPYIPMDSGTLAGAFSLTDIGSGVIVQNTPYARYLYYGELYVDPITGKGAFHDPQTGRFWSRPKVQKVASGRPLNYNTNQHPMAGARWFERMKADHKQDLINIVKENIK